MAEAVSRLGLTFVALTPGSSYRGLQDSFVNYLGNREPTIVLCLHEEHAVAVAHGYAKVAERPMAVALHSNVGLLHASMALYNAYCDRVPMVVLGGAGPLDAAKRRPWIDWIHTVEDQGALVRSFTRFDDQPASVEAAVEAIYRANLLTRTYPCAPTYICLDSPLQEEALPAPLELPDPARFAAPLPPAADPALVAEAARLLSSARRPVVLVGRVSRDQMAFEERVALAERLGACVLTDLKVGAGFPSGHRLQPVAPATFLPKAAKDLLVQADVILSLDWIDLGGTLAEIAGTGGPEARVISCSLDHVLHRGFTKDHFALAPVDLALAAHPDRCVTALIEELGPGAPNVSEHWPGPSTRSSALNEVVDGISVRTLAGALDQALGSTPRCMIRLPLSWSGEDLRVTGPLDYLGQDGGGGVGSGPGMAVGAALALEGTGRLPVAVLGDGDFMMGSSALWTAAHYRLPLLVLVANNRSFSNDEIHQETVALARGRNVENRWIGQHIRDPDPDLAGLSSALGLVSHGPVKTVVDLPAVLEQAIAQVLGGATVVVDVHVDTEAYSVGHHPR